MRNYYAMLGATRQSSVFELKRGLQALEKQARQQTDKASQILLDTDRKECYDKLHLQFEVIALAHSEFAKTDFKDTNQWDRRLVEFVPSEDSDPTFSTLDHTLT